MKVEQIHHVTLIVDRLEEACDFYEQVLKLEPVNMGSVGLSGSVLQNWPTPATPHH